MRTIEITLNGESKSLPAETSVSELLRMLELVPEQVAVEMNRKLVRRAEHAATRLEDGDVLEVVMLVGGG